MVTVFAINAVFLFVLSFIWNSNDWLNAFVKLGLFGLAITNGFMTAISAGWIVKY